MRAGSGLNEDLLHGFKPARSRSEKPTTLHRRRQVPQGAVGSHIKSTGRALEQYIDKRIKIAPRAPDSPLLLNERRRRLCHPTVNMTFRNLLQKCGIAHHKRTGPRIHDLRHAFAVHRLLAWYRQGQDVNALLPALATYMGHVDISSTRVYLQPTAELLQQVNQRFRNHYLKNIHTEGNHESFTR